MFKWDPQDLATQETQVATFGRGAHMLLKKAFAFVPRHSSLADVDSKTQMPKLFYEAGDLVKCFEELGSGAEESAPEEVICEDLQIR